MLYEVITVAGISLNYFNERCDRIRMANIAQTVNVLQALVFTDGPKMVLTPTYWVFEMYKVHQDATLLPATLSCPDYVFEGNKLPALSASASLDKSGAVHISVVNIDPVKNDELTIDLRGRDFSSVSARILTGESGAYNTFEDPEKVKPA